ncbi:hypothetical protein FRB96_001560 [Tulasnella sp. 330]|nr:hypothetical protein FRB96_001560 [Tulasnella sp. 330]KAG8890735.1 hypothetical protein FRB98_006239 [Tulasnella sp. 332]
MSPSLGSHRIQSQLHHHQQPAHETQQYANQQQRTHIPQATQPQRNEQQFQLVESNASNETDAVEIFVDPAMGNPLNLYLDRDIFNSQLLSDLIKKHGGIVASGYSAVQYILVDRQKQSGQSLYRQYHSKKGKVVLDGQWVLACVAARELLTFKKDWGGFKVTGHEVTQPEPPQPPPSPPVAETEMLNTSGSPKKAKAKRKTRAAVRKDSQSVTSETIADATAVATTSATDSLQAHLTAHPPHFTFSAQGPYTLSHPPQPGVSPWGHLPPPQYPSPAVIASTLHAHHEQQARPPPATPPQQQPQLQPQVHHHSQQQHHHQPPQTQLSVQPAQAHPQLTHLSQVHYRPPPQSQPQQHPMHPFAAGPATTPAAALAAARGHWYGVTPATGMPSSPLPTLGQLPAPPATNQASRPNNANIQQTQQSQQPPHAPPPSSSYQQNFNPSGWTQPTSADGVYYSHSFSNPFPDSQYVVGSANPAPAPSALPVAPPTAPSRQALTSVAEEGDGEEHGTINGDAEHRNRKRKRTLEVTFSKPKSKYVAPVVTDLTTLVPALAPPRPSPQPPTRVLKSTYGGNLFTVEDVEYMKKYIDWCVDMGFVLSLREICERLAVKMAPADVDVDGTNNGDDPSMDLEDEGTGDPDAELSSPSYQGQDDHEPRQRLPSVQQIMGVSTSASHIQIPESPNHSSSARLHQPMPSLPAQQNRAVVLQETSSDNSHIHGHPHLYIQASHHRHHNGRDRSPTPPRTLHRSTTGKGIAYSDEDVTFLIKYLNYRRAKDSSLNMQLFWNDVAAKAPHHSRASWLKYWRRHRHEIEVEDSGDALGGGPSGSGNGIIAMQVPINNPGGVPAHPRRSRYSHEDDILLAKFWATDPQGTSDKLFQDFARTHSHHPWKGWQEHHRLHKIQIDHFVKLQKDGVDLDTISGPPTEEPLAKTKEKGTGKSKKRKEKEQD